MNPPNTIRVALADDHHVVRQGIRLLLEQASDIVLVGEAGDGLEALNLVEKESPHVLVVDLGIPRVHGLDVIKSIRRDHKKTKTLVLSTHSDEPFVVESMRSGARGYVLKECDGDELITAVRTVAAGKKYVSPKIVSCRERDLARVADDSPGEPIDLLTARERIVFQLAADGNSIQKIAERLYISPRTAETHRANLMRKLALRSQTDLVRYAIRRGIIQA
jgi:DNA-binding NarL/FixJ family response regulator